jgi:hypothetical protein
MREGVAVFRGAFVGEIALLSCKIAKRRAHTIRAFGVDLGGILVPLELGR